MRALIYVTHLLGVGHFARMGALARALAEAGAEPILVSGGAPVPTHEAPPGRLIQLPPVRARDLSYKELVAPDGAELPSDHLTRRRERLIAALGDTAPEIVVTEQYPFGRSLLKGELEPFIEAASALRPRPLIAASIRDALTPRSKESRVDACIASLRAHYDLVLVHGEAEFMPLEATFPRAREIADMLRYTGYVRSGEARPEPPGREGEGEIVIASGGADQRGALARAGLEAARMGAGGGRLMRILVGVNAQDALGELQSAAEGLPHVVVEPARRDYPNLLKRADLAIAQAGYNTVMDVLAAGVRAILIPLSEAKETEQRDRAAALARGGRALVIPEAELTAATLAAAIERALAAPPPEGPPPPADGAAMAARILIDEARAKAAS